jgi:hypothetical protein
MPKILVSLICTLALLALLMHHIKSDPECYSEYHAC